MFFYNSIHLVCLIFFRSGLDAGITTQVDLPLRNADFAQVEVLVQEGRYHRVDALFLKTESLDSVLPWETRTSTPPLLYPDSCICLRGFYDTSMTAGMISGFLQVQHSTDSSNNCNYVSGYNHDSLNIETLSAVFSFARRLVTATERYPHFRPKTIKLHRVDCGCGVFIQIRLSSK